MRSGTIGTMSHRLGREEQVGLPRVDPLGLRARARRPITEAVDKITIESNLVNRASKDRVWDRYYHNGRDHPYKPYPP
jgi:hypothetical protein